METQPKAFLTTARFRDALTPKSRSGRWAEDLRQLEILGGLDVGNRADVAMMCEDDGDPWKIELRARTALSLGQLNSVTSPEDLEG